ncbi:ABC transporter permease [Pseudaminobacter sp. NGMCC 1.201702]|uniref:ABC transporter permease n=1 Tax=Pseudaminobacter sp. NGMCC 1.201702 TaxID=3391825 RepID=UPI0039F13631
MSRRETGSPAGCWALFIARSVARVLLVLFGVALFAFLLAKMSPIDPVEAYLGPRISMVGDEQRMLIAEHWGLDQPTGVQFMKWLTNLLSGDLGWSMIHNASVADVIWTRFSASFVMMGLAWLLSGALGFSLGIVAGAFEHSTSDRLIRFYCYTLAATPTFWIAIVLLMTFSVALGWAPVCCSGPPGVMPEDVSLLDRARHMLLPVLTLSMLGVAQVALHTRVKMIEIMRSDYAIYAFAQGASRLEVAVSHGMRNAALPAITILFATTGELFGGSVLAEQVFAYPGLGKATIDAGIRGDVPLLLAITLSITLFVSVGNAIADVLYHVVDPRMRPIRRLS